MATNLYFQKLAGGSEPDSSKCIALNRNEIEEIHSFRASHEEADDWIIITIINNSWNFKIRCTSNPLKGSHFNQDPSFVLLKVLVLSFSITNVLKSTLNENLNNKYALSLKEVKKASDCYRILLKRFFVQFYTEENLFILINNETAI